MGWLTTAMQAHGVTLREAFVPPSNDPDVRGDSLNPFRAYRSLTQQPNQRGLTPLDQSRMIEIAVYLYDANPMAKSLIELINDFIVGEGFALKSKHEDLQRILDTFWHDPVNAWPQKQFQRFRQLSIFGDQTWPTFVRRGDGRVRLGYIDPANIQAVMTDPDNAEVLVSVHRKQPPGMNLPPIPIIRVDERSGSRTEGYLMGGDPRAGDTISGTFFFAINNLSNSPRGRSDLLTIFDWLDLYDQFLFGQAERAAHLSDFVYDVTLKGFTPDQMRQWAVDNPMPTGASMRVHNENVTWQVVSPNLQASDVSEQARTIRGQIATPHRLPEGWLFQGAESNRAILAEQAIPTYKYLSRRQHQVKAMLQHIGEFVRDQAIIAGALPKIGRAHV